MKSTTWSPLFALSILFSLQVSGRRISHEEQQDLHSFVTRPDLKAPKWDISVHDEQSSSPGYWFISTYDGKSRTDRSEGWIGPHIYDNMGQLVWSGAKMSERTGTVDFQLQIVNGKNVMTIYRPDEDHVTYLDQHYEEIHDEHLAGGVQIHDSVMLDDGQSAIVITRDVGEATEAESRAVGLEEGICKGEYYGFQELSTTTGTSSFSWSSQRHINMKESTMEGVEVHRRCNRREGWDFLHLNSVSKCPDGDYLISGQYTDTIYRVSRKDGSILWRLGGKRNQFTKGPQLSFSRQSSLQCLKANLTHTTLSFLDNARSGKKEDLQFPSNVMSRGLLLTVNMEDMHATLLQSFPHPYGPGHFAHDRSTYQTLPDSHNAFISWTNGSLISETSPTGDLVLQAQLLPEWLSSYKVYRYPLSAFVGEPLGPPDVFAQAETDAATNTTKTRVHVSWNGATEIGNWTLYKTNRHGATSLPLLTKPKEGFETEFVHDGFLEHVLLEALDAAGEVLVRSPPQTTSPPPELMSASSEMQTEWLNHMAALSEAEGGNFRGAATFVGILILAAILLGLGYSSLRSAGLLERLRRKAWFEEVQGYLPMGSPLGRRQSYSRVEVEDF